MSLILTRESAIQQPQYVPQIEWDNPLCEGLVFLHGGVPGWPDLVGNRAPNMLGTFGPDTIGTAGQSYGFGSNTASVWYPRDTMLEPAGAVTALALVQVTGTLGPNVAPFCKEYKNNTDPYLSYDVEYNDTGSQNIIRANIAIAGIGLVNGNTLTIPNNGQMLPHIVGIRYDSSHIHTIYNNQYSSVSQSGAIEYDTSGTSNFIVSGASSASVVNPFNGLVYWTPVWNRAITDNELDSFVANPFQLVWRKRTKFFAVGGGGTHSLAGTPGSFALTTNNSTLNYDRKLLGSVGSFVLAPSNSTLNYGRKLSGLHGDFTFTASVGALSVSRMLPGDAWIASLTGQPGTLSYSPGAGKVAYSLAGSAWSAAIYTQSANAVYGRSIVGVPFAVTLAGEASTSQFSHKLAGAQATLSALGQIASVDYGRHLTASTADLPIAWVPASGVVGRVVYGATGLIVLSGQAATLNYSGHAPIGYRASGSVQAFTFAGIGADLAWLSRGNSIMPSVIGMDFYAALLSLQDAGVYEPLPAYSFMPSQISVKLARSPVRSGFVTNQSIIAGAAVAPGASITLTVSDFPLGAVIDMPPDWIQK